MLMINSYKKGRRWEQEAAKLLTKTTGKQHFRVPNSGAMSTSLDIKDQRFQGDIFVEDPEHQTVIECKYVNKLSLNMLLSKKGNIHRWISKLEEYPDWILLIKLRNAGAYAITPYKETMYRLFPKHDWNTELKLNLRHILIKII